MHDVQLLTDTSYLCARVCACVIVSARVLVCVLCVRTCVCVRAYVCIVCACVCVCVCRLVRAPSKLMTTSVSHFIVRCTRFPLRSHEKKSRGKEN